MFSDTDICNMALEFHGADPITDIKEESSSANTCRRFYETVVVGFIKSMDWSWARLMVTLDELSDEPIAEYQYSLLLPPKFLSLKKVYTTPNWRLYKNRVLYADTDSVLIDHMSRVPESEFPADVALAMSMRLSSLIAKSITGSDSAQRNAFAEFLELNKMARTAELQNQRSKRLNLDHLAVDR